MKSKRALLYGAVSCIAITVLILDSKTALAAAGEGVDLCIRTVIPSLFPFIMMSILLTGSLAGSVFRPLRPIGKLCRIPQGSETLLAIGLLGGYPVGAQCAAQAYQSGQLSKETARRMLGFCSNAGPAFIFGMAGTLFSSPTIPWLLWGIQILSAILTGALLPGASEEVRTPGPSGTVGITEALQTSLRVMAGICGWVVIFRIIISFCQRWFLWLFSDTVQVLFMGLLELTNGCCALAELPESTAFLLCALFLSFGGICVGMQTVSVTRVLGTGAYFPGKLLQSSISLLLASMVGNHLYGTAMVSPLILSVLAALCALLLIYIRRGKNNSSNLTPLGV